MNNDIFQKLQQKIDAGGTFQPVLFLWENLELVNVQVKNIIFELFEYYQIDKNNLYVLPDNNEKIKIQAFREFSAKSNMKSSYAFQVFLIENISRATMESFNAALKFLEEPGVWNIVIVTSQSESSIPETVLSRLQIMNLFSSVQNKKNEFFYKLIDEYISAKNVSLLKYFFQDKKIEKQDYLDFLETFFLYIKEEMVYVELLDQISESIMLIQKNNVLPKYEIDKLFLKM